MKRHGITAIAAALALAFGAVSMAAQGMPKQEYDAARASIAAEYKSAIAKCRSLSANAKDVCMAEAKGSEKVAKAELEARNKPSEKARHAVSIAKAEADYAVARERCDDKTGSDKTACVKEAKAAEARAKADAKPQRQATAAPASRTQTAGEYVDDAVITTKVKAAVFNEATLKSAEINVETFKGVVQLSGFVSSQANIITAIGVARGVSGVTSVRDGMRLK